MDDDVPRVCGVLAVTRAFGNNSIKATVNAEPEVSKHSITDDFEYIVIASDGVWDVLSNEDVVRKLFFSHCSSPIHVLASHVLCHVAASCLKVSRVFRQELCTTQRIGNMRSET